MTKIEKDEVKRIADIARIAITEEEADQLTKDLSDFLTFSEQLNEVDTTNVEPTIYGLKIKNVLREDDQPSEGLAIEDIFRNAPDHDEDGHIRVPSILE